MKRVFVERIERVAEQEVDLIRFNKKQRLADVAKEYLKNFEYEEGMMFIGSGKGQGDMH